MSLSLKQCALSHAPPQRRSACNYARPHFAILSLSLSPPLPLIHSLSLSLSLSTHTHIHTRSRSTWEKVKKGRGKEREGRESVIPGLSLRLSPLWVLVPSLTQWGFSTKGLHVKIKDIYSPRTPFLGCVH